MLECCWSTILRDLWVCIILPCVKGSSLPNAAHFSHTLHLHTVTHLGHSYPFGILGDSSPGGSAHWGFSARASTPVRGLPAAQLSRSSVWWCQTWFNPQSSKESTHAAPAHRVTHEPVKACWQFERDSSPAGSALLCFSARTSTLVRSF